MEVKGNYFSPRPIPCTQPELEVSRFDCEERLMNFGPMLESFCFEIDFMERFLEPESLKEEVADLNKNYVGYHFNNFKKDYHHRYSIVFAKNLMEYVESANRKQPVQKDMEVPQLMSYNASWLLGFNMLFENLIAMEFFFSMVVLQFSRTDSLAHQLLFRTGAYFSQPVNGFP